MLTPRIRIKCTMFYNNIVVFPPLWDTMAHLKLVHPVKNEQGWTEIGAWCYAQVYTDELKDWLTLNKLMLINNHKLIYFIRWNYDKAIKHHSFAVYIKLRCHIHSIKSRTFRPADVLARLVLLFGKNPQAVAHKGAVRKYGAEIPWGWSLPECFTSSGFF